MSAISTKLLSPRRSGQPRAKAFRTRRRSSSAATADLERNRCAIDACGRMSLRAITRTSRVAKMWNDTCSKQCSKEAGLWRI